MKITVVIIKRSDPIPIGPLRKKKLKRTEAVVIAIAIAKKQEPPLPCILFQSSVSFTTTTNRNNNNNRKKMMTTKSCRTCVCFRLCSFDYYDQEERFGGSTCDEAYAI
mmetsp:Transcript_51685/g.57716  ORF Transcript_51685/g.57716 Transcript_51685/m.57716 type:complete len:108 (-) Transcript_51685:320-643(-)